MIHTYAPHYACVSLTAALLFLSISSPSRLQLRLPYLGHSVKWACKLVKLLNNHAMCVRSGKSSRVICERLLTWHRLCAIFLSGLFGSLPKLTKKGQPSASPMSTHLVCYSKMLKFLLFVSHFCHPSRLLFVCTCG